MAKCASTCSSNLSKTVKNDGHIRATQIARNDERDAFYRALRKLNSVSPAARQPLILLPGPGHDRGPFDSFSDTRAGTSLLSSDLAKQLDAKVLGSKKASAGGKVSVSLATVDSLAVAKRNCVMSMLELSIFQISARPSAQKIDGDLGYNFLNIFASQLIIAIVRFDSRIRSVPKFWRSGETEVPIRLASPAKPLILVRRPRERSRPISIRDRHRHFDNGDYAGAGEAASGRNVASWRGHDRRSAGRFSRRIVAVISARRC